MFEAWATNPVRQAAADPRHHAGDSLAFAAIWRSRWSSRQGRTGGGESNHRPFGLGFAGTVATQQWLSGCEVEPLEETDLTSSLPEGGDSRVRLSIADMFDYNRL